MYEFKTVMFRIHDVSHADERPKGDKEMAALSRDGWERDATNAVVAYDGIRVIHTFKRRIPNPSPYR